MKQQAGVGRASMGLYAVVAALGLALALADTATAQAMGADADVLVLATHFVYRGSTVDDLDGIERAVMPRTPQSVALHACGPAAARSLLAAAHRFRHLEIRLRLRDEDDAACAGEARRRIAALGSGREASLLVIDHAAVQRWWAEQMP